MRRPALLLAASLVVLTGGAVAPSVATAAPTPARHAPRGPPSAGTGRPVEVTLITGDRVTIADQDGRDAISVAAADRGRVAVPVSFSTSA